MSFRNNGNKRDPKKLFSAFMCLIISGGFFYMIAKYGFSIGNLVFGVLSLYFSISFFRKSNEW